MGCSPYDTTGWDPRQQERLLADGWEQEIVPRLPKALDEQAYTLQAMERARKLRRASDLLRGLLGYVLCVSSFRQLGAWAVLLGVACLSDNGWRKRLRTASAWLGWLVSELVAAQRLQESCLRGRVLLVDATRVRQVGGTGDDWRVHTAYDLLAGRLAEVRVTDQHGAEELSWVSSLQADDIVGSSNGYGYRSSVARVVQQAAHLVTYVTPSTFPVQTKQGQRIDVLAWLRQLSSDIASLQCWCQDERACYQVRLIALRLSDEATKRRQEHKRHQAQKAGRQVSAEALELAGWILVATTLPEESWPAEAVLRLYRARWHIELLFKRIKQLLRLVAVRGRTVETALATIRLWLVAWALRAVRKPASCGRCCSKCRAAKRMRSRAGKRSSAAFQVDEQALEDGEAAVLQESEPEALVNQQAAVLQESEPEARAWEPQTDRPVGCLQPATSWEAITADWHSSELSPLSHWRLNAICLQTLRQQVQGSWTQARLLACAPLLRRYLLDCPRRRVQLETAVRRWLAPPRPPIPKGRLTAPQLILCA